MEKAEPENNTMTDCPPKDPAVEALVVESTSGSLWERIAELPLVDSDRSRCLSQPACLQQWHGNTCGHHAVFNIRCLLNGQPEKLQEGIYFPGEGCLFLLRSPLWRIRLAR